MIKWIKKLFSRDNKTISDVILVDGLTAEGKPNDESIPWIKIEGMPDKKGQIKIEADWTSGLISCLREHYGYVGSSEFVRIWNSIFKNIHGTYNYNNDNKKWFCVINSKLKLNKIKD